MSQTINRARARRQIRFSILPVMMAFAVLILGFFFSPCSARAEDPNDQYLSIYGKVQQADSLVAGGQTGPALAKYKEAQIALADFQKGNQAWNTKVVAFRLNYLREKIAGLSEKAATSARPSAAGVPGPAHSGASQVKLLSAGAEPRKVLRLHPKPGDKQAVTMTMKLGMDMKMGEMQNPVMKLPPMIFVMDATIKSIAAGGDIGYETVISDASVADEPGVMPQIAESMKNSMAGFKGLSGSGVFSDRGISKAAEIKVPAGVDAQSRQTMEQMRDSFARAGAPFPEEAVGVGAKWEVRMPIKNQGMTVDQTAAYELVSVDGEHVSTKSSVTQRAANQKIENPMMPGAKIDVTKMSGTGAGEIVLDLGQLLPTEATMNSHSESSMAMAMGAGAQKQVMTVKVDMNLRLESK